MNELMEASYDGEINIMRHILYNNNDIDINTQDIDGWNILISYLRSRIVRINFFTIYDEINFINYLLYDRNININAQDTEGNTALITAVLFYDEESGSNQIIDALLRHTQLNINIENNEGINALMIASSVGYFEVVNMLLRLNPNLNAIDNYGNTAITNAFENRSTDIVDILIEAGADVNIRSHIILKNQEIMENTIIPYLSSLLLHNENNIVNQVDINNDLVSEISRYLLRNIDGKRTKTNKKKKTSSSIKKKSRKSKKKKSMPSKKKKSRTIKKKY